MCLYLLSLTGPEDDLTGSWLNGLTLMHFAVMGGNLSFLQALVQRGVEFDVRNGRMMPPVHFAVTMCRLPVLHFWLAQYRARGREQQDVLREVEGWPNAGGPRQPLLFRIVSLEEDKLFHIRDEERRAMATFLVREAAADIWAEGRIQHRVADDELTKNDILFPLHLAALSGNQPLLDFFLTECGMPIDTRTRGLQLAALHLLAMSPREEVHLLPIMKWLVEEKGADMTCVPSCTASGPSRGQEAHSSVLASAGGTTSGADKGGESGGGNRRVTDAGGRRSHGGTVFGVGGGG